MAALLVECPTPYPISNFGEDSLRSLVISGFQIIEASVVKCAEVAEEGRPQLSERKCREESLL